MYFTQPWYNIILCGSLGSKHHLTHSLCWCIMLAMVQLKDLITVKHGKATTVQDSLEKCLTEKQQILNRWAEYCSELYNHKANGDPTVLNCPRQTQSMAIPSFAKKWRLQYNHWRKGKSAGVDNIPAKLVQAGVITALTTICNTIWQRGEWWTPWIQSLVITLFKKGNLQQCKNYPTISLISHQAKSCWRSNWKDWSHKWRRSSLKNRQASEQAEATQSRSSTYKSYVKNISSTNKTSTMSS